jgi:hypothetical protein
MQVSDLKHNKRNPRKISNEKKKMLQKAIEEFGDLGGIVFNKRTGQLVGGHQRTSVIPKNAEVVIEVSHEAPTRTGTTAEGHIKVKGEMFRYREVDWDLQREESANIAANQHGGEWQEDNLRAILADLVSQGADMELIGFTTDELAKLMGSVEVYDAKTDEDDVGEPPKEPRSKLGDVYKIGNHRLMCGDSTSVDAVKTLINEIEIDLLLTDPPYGMSVVKPDGNIDGERKGSVVGASKMHKAKVGVYKPIIGDDEPFEPQYLLTYCREQIIFGATISAHVLPRTDYLWSQSFCFKTSGLTSLDLLVQRNA